MAVGRIGTEPPVDINGRYVPTAVHTEEFKNRMVYGFESFSGQMHLGPKTGPLCPAFYARLKETSCVTETPDGSTRSYLISPGSNKKEPR